MAAAVPESRHEAATQAALDRKEKRAASRAAVLAGMREKAVPKVLAALGGVPGLVRSDVRFLWRGRDGKSRFRLNFWAKEPAAAGGLVGSARIVASVFATLSEDGARLRLDPWPGGKPLPA